MAKYRKTFGNLSVGAVVIGDLTSDGWNDYDPGSAPVMACVADANDAALDGKALEATAASGAVLNLELAATEDGSIDQDILISIRFDTVPTTFDFTAFGCNFRMYDGGVNPANNMTGVSDADWQSQTFQGGSYSVKSFGEGSITNVSTPLSTGTWYYLRMQHDSDGAGNYTRRAKIWLQTSAEPAGWDFDSTDDAFEWDSAATPGDEQLGGMGIVALLTNNPVGSKGYIGGFAASDDLADPVTVSEFESGLAAGVGQLINDGGLVNAGLVGSRLVGA